VSVDHIDFLELELKTMKIERRLRDIIQTVLELETGAVHKKGSVDLDRQRWLFLVELAKEDTKT